MSRYRKTDHGVEFLCDWCGKPLGLQIKMSRTWPVKTYHDPECWDASAPPDPALIDGTECAP